MLRAAEVDAQLTEDGVMLPRWETLNAARNWYPKTSQRFPEIIRKFAASGLMGLPSVADLQTPALADIEQYLQAKNLTGPERVKLFTLAQDASISAFSSRQAPYEYFFFGDPVRMAGALVRSYDLTPSRSRVVELLERD